MKKAHPNPFTKKLESEMPKRYVPSAKRQKQLDSARGMNSSRNMLRDNNMATDATQEGIE